MDILNYVRALLKGPDVNNSSKEGIIRMWLVAGLGNPGNEYKHHRHNVGFMAVDAINNEHSFAPFRSKFQGEISIGKISDEKILLLKPKTYMNLSGESLAPAAHFYKIDPDRILVFHDEIDLPAGEVRIKKGGGNAGHNGLKSIQSHLGTPDFWRVRIGVGRPEGKIDVSDHVLSNFSKTDEDWLTPLLQEITKHINVFFDENPAAYEKKLNQNTKKKG